MYRCITHIHLSNLQPCLPSSPREGAADQEKGKDSWKEGGSKREVFLCPKGLVSVCLNQEVRMWRQERQSRDILSVCVCVCAPCWAEVSYMWRSQLHAGGNQGWCSKSLKCQRQLLWYGPCLCVFVHVNVFWDVWWRLILLLESKSENVI